MKKYIFLLQPVAEPELLTGPFYVIDLFNGPAFVTSEDGLTKAFDSFEEAEVEAADCQQGYVICFE